MTNIDLGTIKLRWQAQEQRLPHVLRVDIEGVRELLRKKARSSMQRHLGRLAIAILVDVALLGALVWFGLLHLHDPLYLLCAIALLALLAIETLNSVRERYALQQLDGAAPLLQSQTTLSVLATRRRTSVKWALLLSALIGWPMLAVLLKATLGFDLLRGLHWSVAAINFGMGAAIIPVALFITDWFGKSKFGSTISSKPNSSRSKGRSDHSGDDGFETARSRWHAYAVFEDALARGDHETLAILAAPIAWSNAALLQAQALERRLLIAALLYAGLLLLNSVLIARAETSLQLVPAIFLQLSLVLLMVPNLIQFMLIRQWKQSLPMLNAAKCLRQFVGLRARLLSSVAIAAPLLLLVACEVFANAIWAVSLFSLLGAGGCNGAIILACGLSVWCARNKRLKLISQLLSLGSLKASVDLADRLASEHTQEP